MNSYRTFLIRQHKIVAHHEFSAEKDEWACRAVALAFDACADDCDDFELWDGARLVTTRAGLRLRAAAAKADQASAEADLYATVLEEAINGLAVRILEAAMATSDALRASPRLNEKLSVLRRSPDGAQPP